MRHTFATLALQNGVDIKTVYGMLGHFFAGFTLDTYAHVTTARRNGRKHHGARAECISKPGIRRCPVVLFLVQSHLPFVYITLVVLL